MNPSIRVRMTVTEVSSNATGGQKITARAGDGSPTGRPTRRSERLLAELTAPDSASGQPPYRNLQARAAWEARDENFRRDNPYQDIPSAEYLRDNPGFAYDATGSMEITINNTGVEQLVQKGSEIHVSIQLADAPQTDVDVEAGRVIAREGRELPASANADVRRGHAEQRAFK